jgi:hypothetical protein
MRRLWCMELRSLVPLFRHLRATLVAIRNFWPMSQAGKWGSNYRDQGFLSHLELSKPLPASPSKNRFNTRWHVLYLPL